MTRYAGTYIMTIKEEDIGKRFCYRVKGHPHAFQPLGTIKTMDIGKHIFKHRGVYQVENPEHVERRLHG